MSQEAKPLISQQQFSELYWDARRKLGWKQLPDEAMAYLFEQAGMPNLPGFQDHLDSGRFKKKTFGSGFSEKGVADYIPFVRGAKGAMELADIFKSAKRIEAGTGDEADAQRLMGFMLESQRRESFGATVGSILSDLPATGVEFATGGGIAAKAGQKALVRTARKKIFDMFDDKLGAKVFRLLVDKGVKASVIGLTGGVARIPEEMIQRSLADAKIAVDEDDLGDLELLVADTGDWLEFLPEAVVSQIIEAGSEMAGAGLTKLDGTKAVARWTLLNALARSAKAQPNTRLGQILTKMGYQGGVLGGAVEVGEEVLGDLARAGFDVVPGLDMNESFAGAFDRKWLEEFIAMSIPGAAAKGFQLPDSSQKPITFPDQEMADEAAKALGFTEYTTREVKDGKFTLHEGEDGAPVTRQQMSEAMSRKSEAESAEAEAAEAETPTEPEPESPTYTAVTERGGTFVEAPGLAKKATRLAKKLGIDVFWFDGPTDTEGLSAEPGSVAINSRLGEEASERVASYQVFNSIFRSLEVKDQESLFERLRAVAPKAMDHFWEQHLRTRGRSAFEGIQPGEGRRALRQQRAAADMFASISDVVPFMASPAGQEMYGEMRRTQKGRGFLEKMIDGLRGMLGKAPISEVRKAMLDQNLQVLRGMVPQVEGIDATEFIGAAAIMGDVINDVIRNNRDQLGGVDTLVEAGVEPTSGGAGAVLYSRRRVGANSPRVRRLVKESMERARINGPFGPGKVKLFTKLNSGQLSEMTGVPIEFVKPESELQKLVAEAAESFRIPLQFYKTGRASFSGLNYAGVAYVDASLGQEGMIHTAFHEMLHSMGAMHGYNDAFWDLYQRIEDIVGTDTLLRFSQEYFERAHDGLTLDLNGDGYDLANMLFDEQEELWLEEGLADFTGSLGGLLLLLSSEQGEAVVRELSKQDVTLLARLMDMVMKLLRALRLVKGKDQERARILSTSLVDIADGQYAPEEAQAAIIIRDALRMFSNYVVHSERVDAAERIPDRAPILVDAYIETLPRGQRGRHRAWLSQEDRGRMVAYAAGVAMASGEPIEDIAGYEVFRGVLQTKIGRQFYEYILSSERPQVLYSTAEPGDAESQEESLFRRAVSGDPDAVSEMYTKYMPGMVAQAKRQLGEKLRGQVDPEDIAQEAFLGLLSDLPKLEWRSAKQWQANINLRVSNTLTDKVREQRAQKRGGGRVVSADAMDQDEGGGFDIEDAGLSPLQQAEVSETQEAVQQMLGRLSEREANVVRMHALEGMTHKEIAEALGIGESTSRRVLSQAKKKLASMEAFSSPANAPRREPDPVERPRRPRPDPEPLPPVSRPVAAEPQPVAQPDPAEVERLERGRRELEELERQRRAMAEPEPRRVVTPEAQLLLPEGPKQSDYLAWLEKRHRELQKLEAQRSAPAEPGTEITPEAQLLLPEPAVQLPTYTEAVEAMRAEYEASLPAPPIDLTYEEMVEAGREAGMEVPVQAEIEWHPPLQAEVAPAAQPTQEQEARRARQERRAGRREEIRAATSKRPPGRMTPPEDAVRGVREAFVEGVEPERDLAGVSTDPAERAFTNAVDAFMERSGEPTHYRIRTARNFAHRILNRFGDKQIRNFLLQHDITNWTIEQTMAAQILVGRHTRQAMSEEGISDAKVQMEAIRLHWRYRQARAYQARTLGMVRDPYTRTYRDELEELLMTPTLAQQQKIARLEREIKKLKRQLAEGKTAIKSELERKERQVLEEAEKEVKRVRRSKEIMRAKGIDPSKLITADLRDPMVAREAAEAVYRARTEEREGWFNPDLFLAWRYNSMLSWLSTHQRNLWGNTFNIFSEVVLQRAVEGVIADNRRKRGKVVGDAPYVEEMKYLFAPFHDWGDTPWASPSEIADRFFEDQFTGDYSSVSDEQVETTKGIVTLMMEAVTNALSMAWVSYTSGMPAVELALRRRGMDTPHVTGKLESAAAHAVPSRDILGLDWVAGRALQAGDAFSQSLVMSAVPSALAIRWALKSGFRGLEMRKVAYTILQDPTHPVWEQSYNEALNATFQGGQYMGFGMDSLQKWAVNTRFLMDTLTSLPLGSMIMPFITTPIRIYAAGMRKVLPLKLAQMWFRYRRTKAKQFDRPSYRVLSSAPVEFTVPFSVASLVEGVIAEAEADQNTQVVSGKRTTTINGPSDLAQRMVDALRQQIPNLSGKKRAAASAAMLRIQSRIEEARYSTQPDYLVKDLADLGIAAGIQALVLGLVMGKGDDDEPLVTGGLKPWGAERDLQYRLGGPMTIKTAFGRYYYGGLEPFATTFSPIVDATEAFVAASRSGKPESLASSVGAFTRGVINGVQDKTFLKTLGDMVELAQSAGTHGDSSASKFLRDVLVTPMIPNVVRGSLRESDKYLRNNMWRKTPETGWWSAWLDPKQWARIAFPVPGAPWTPTPIRDIWGEPVERPVRLVNRVLSAELLDALFDVVPGSAIPSKDMPIRRVDIYLARWNEMVLMGEAGPDAEPFDVKSIAPSADYTAEEADFIARTAGPRSANQIAGVELDFENINQRTVDIIKKIIRRNYGAAQRQVRAQRRD